MTDEKTRALIDAIRGPEPEGMPERAGHFRALALLAADALSALTVPDGDVRERLVESIAGGTISIPGGYAELAHDDAENIVDTILSDPVLSRAAAPEESEAAIARVRALHQRDVVLADYCEEGSDFGTDQHPPGQMVEWPCSTLQALGPLPVGGETDGK